MVDDLKISLISNQVKIVNSYVEIIIGCDSGIKIHDVGFSGVIGPGIQINLREIVEREIEKARREAMV